MPKVGISKIIRGCKRAGEYWKTLEKPEYIFHTDVNVEIASH